MFLQNGSPKFWKQICYHWFEYKQVQKLNVQQIIWCNSNVLIENVPILISKCVNKGLIYIYQLYKDNGEWRDEQDMLTEFNLNWFEYQKIKRAISQYGELDIKEYVELYNELGKCKRKTTKIYSTLCNNEEILNHVQIRLNGYFEVTIKEIQDAYKALYKQTNIVKYRDFQYRLLSNAIYTNNVLYHWKKVPSQRCDWCHEPKQTVEHMLFLCPVTYKFWQNFCIYVNKKYNFNNVELDVTKLTYKSIFLGNVVTTDVAHIANFFVLVAKQYIFACKCLTTIPSIDELTQKIKWLYKIEKYNAIKTNTLSKHQKKWHNICTMKPIQIKSDIDEYVFQYLLNIPT